MAKTDLTPIDNTVKAQGSIFQRAPGRFVLRSEPTSIIVNCQWNALLINSFFNKANTRVLTRSVHSPVVSKKVIG